MFQKLWDTAQRTFIVITAYLNKQEKSQSNLTPKETRTTTKPKARRRKKIKIREEINRIETNKKQ